MKITWLGQAGLLFEKNGKTVMIDPYLSDSVVKVNPLNFRRVPAEEKFFDMTPDVMIFTHDHLDHYDPETAPRFINENTAAVPVILESFLLNLTFTVSRSEHSDFHFDYFLSILYTQVCVYSSPAS